jgi:HSP20 family protein
MAFCKASATMRFDKRLGSQNARKASSDTFWVPNTDVYVVEDQLVIRVELAGIKREDIDVSAEGPWLTIRGHRSDCCREKDAKCKFLVMEINYGAFESRIELPAHFDLGQAKAAYQNGFLRIEVPKKHPHSSNNLHVNVTDEQS